MVMHDTYSEDDYDHDRYDAEEVPSNSNEVPSWEVSSSPIKASATSKVIRVVAPKTLPEGYLFDVLVEGKEVTITVPKGGVQEGEHFEVPHPAAKHAPMERDAYPEQAMDDANHADSAEALTENPTASQEEEESKFQPKDRDELGAPFGRWRYSLCSCLDVVTQATFWMALCCTPVLIAQLVTRLRLNWKGKRDVTEETILSYNKIILSFLAVLALGNLSAFAGFPVLFLYLFGILLYTGRNVRRTMRERYKIPPSVMSDSMDDCCCMLPCCCCCSTVQMSRHTHDDKEYPGFCCTPSGLDLDAPAIPV